MRSNDSFYDIIDQVVTHGVHKGILHLYNEDESFPNNSMILKGKQVVNFGSCSYLGLEFDARLKEAAKKAIDQYGTQFSSSRAYISLGLYKKLEYLFEEIFEASCVVTPTTTLGHIANLPVLVNDADAIIIDQQVHSSVQTAAALLKARGVYTELLQHNRMDLLEERIQILQNKCSKVWYMADGIYSMFGDGCPVDTITALLNQYERFHLYVDDAHGMSIYGKNGRGYVLNNNRIHPKMVLATSLAKAFATGGAVMVYPNKELARKVRTCGGPLITSGPLQPANLGSAIAAALIHLSPEVYDMQQELHDKIQYAACLLKECGLPVVSAQNAAVFFVGASLPRLGYNVVNRMLHAGYYVNLAVFPAVAMKNAGVRFTVTRLHSYIQIEQMIATMAEEFSKALTEEEMHIEEIYKAFKKPVPEEIITGTKRTVFIRQSTSLQVHHYKTIEDVNTKEWNEVFENKGTFDWKGLQTLEASFTNNLLPENNWLFDYIIIKDRNDNIITACFITTATWKDDMLSSSSVSLEVEKRRMNDPMYLTSRVIAAGSLLTEGEHLFIDKTSPLWKDAMQLLTIKFVNCRNSIKPIVSY